MLFFLSNFLLDFSPDTPYNGTSPYGGVSEWFKELVLKTSESARARGFESYLLRFMARWSSG